MENNEYNPEAIHDAGVNPPEPTVGDTASDLIHAGQRGVNNASNLAQGINNMRKPKNSEGELPDKKASPNGSNMPGQVKNKPSNDLDNQNTDGSNNLNTKDNPNNNLSNPNKDNVAKGVNLPKSSDENKSPNASNMPGVKNNDNKSKENKNIKKPETKSKEKGNKLNKKGSGKNRFMPALGAANPFNRNKRKKDGESSVSENQSEEKENSSGAGAASLAGNLLGKVINKLPIQYRVIAYVALPIAAALLVILIILAIFLTTTVTTMSDICETNSSSDQSGTAEVTAADTKDFLCKMQSPFGNKSYPVYGWVGEQRSTHVHAGVDLSLGCGTPIYAAQGGTVYISGTEGGYGNSVVISHSNGKFYTRYGHMSQRLVNKGDKVNKGQLIGKVGNTGASAGCHLHFEVREKSSYGTTVKAINDYFNASKATEHKTMNVSESFKKQCGSAWDGEPVGASASGGSKSSNNSSSTTSSDFLTESTSSDCCVSTSSSSSSSDTTYCPNGITVTGRDAGTYDINQYIERVVTCENGGANTEALKALAIAARTYAINRTDNCKKSISNSTSAQVMSTGSCTKASNKVKNALKDVSGSVLLYNGKYFSAEYSSFWGSCSGSTCTSTIKKVPSSKTVTYSIPSSYVTIARGHNRGLSQNGSNYMASQGKKYDEILKFFYADGIEITGATGSSCSLGGDSFNGKVWPYYQGDYQQKYGNGTIATKGCGPTSMAMVVSSFLNAKHDPVELANYGMSINSYVVGQGTSWAFFKKAGDKYGLNVKQLNVSKNAEVLAALNGGKSLVIAAMGPSTFTSGGHFIVLTGTKNGEVSVQDPASRERSKKTWNFKNPIVKEAKQFWIISKG